MSVANGTALEIARWIVLEKIARQRKVVESLHSDPEVEKKKKPKPLGSDPGGGLPESSGAASCSERGQFGEECLLVCLRPGFLPVPQCVPHIQQRLRGLIFISEECAGLCIGHNFEIDWWRDASGRECGSVGGI